jgi:hypothetical protein
MNDIAQQIEGTYQHQSKPLPPLTYYVAVLLPGFTLDMAGPFPSKEAAYEWIDGAGGRWFGPMARYHVGIPMNPANATGGGSKSLGR